MYLQINGISVKTGSDAFLQPHYTCQQYIFTMRHFRFLKYASETVIRIKFREVEIVDADGILIVIEVILKYKSF